MLSRQIVFGYHGCDASVAERVVTGKGDLFKSESQYEWLGHGIYFWEESPHRALQWAAQKKKEGTHGIKTPAVVGAIIDLGVCLNLTDSESLALVKASYEWYCAAKQSVRANIAQNLGKEKKARILDCEVIEYLHYVRDSEKNLPFDTVRSFFSEGRELYEGSGFQDLNHIQICVREPQSIKGYFLPR